MAVESNVNMYYEELVQDMAIRAKENLDDGNYGDESECINQAIDDGLMYYVDQAYVVAHALVNGFIEWGKDPIWDEIYEMLYDDVADDLNDLKNKE